MVRSCAAFMVSDDRMHFVKNSFPKKNMLCVLMIGSRGDSIHRSVQRFDEENLK